MSISPALLITLELLPLSLVPPLSLVVSFSFLFIFIIKKDFNNMVAVAYAGMNVPGKLYNVQIQQSVGDSSTTAQFRYYGIHYIIIIITNTNYFKKNKKQ